MARMPSPLNFSMTAYATYTEADTYFANRLHVVAWNGATNANKTIALTEATQRIDRLRFGGYLLESDQELEFPRYYDLEAGPEGDEEVPDDIKIATYELAFALLDGVDPDLEYENMAVSSQAYGSVRMSNTPDGLPHIAAGIPSMSAWRYLAPYLASGKAIRIRRVS